MRKVQVGRVVVSRNARLLGAAASVVALALALAACAPQVPQVDAPQDAPVLASASDGETADGDAAVDEVANGAAQTPGAAFGYADFRDKSSGDYPESYFTETFVNAGNRGCNACHEDLWTLIENLNPLQHLASSAPGYGKDATYMDCYLCHDGTPLHGVMLKEPIHSAHYGSRVFTDEIGGNCFSCHALDQNNAYVMFDAYKHTDEFGGFKDSGSDRQWAWVQGREWPNGHVTGISMARDMDVSLVSMDQDPSAQEDMYSASNYAIPQIDAKDYVLKVTGVQNERTFTLDELKALPQTDVTMLEVCVVNTIGSYQIGNVPARGVLIKDLVEACGGVPEGTNAVSAVGEDGWNSVAPSLDFLLENDGFIMLEAWGEPLSVEAGYPAAFAMPTAPAGLWNKWLIELNFLPTDGLSDFHFISGMDYVEEPGVVSASGRVASVNSGWLSPVNDGETVNASGPVRLEGYACNWGHNGSRIEQIAFSLDYGNTWTYIDVPADFDMKKWTHWVVDWNPPAPGTYELYLCAIDSVYGWQQYPSAITVIAE